MKKLLRKRWLYAIVLIVFGIQSYAQDNEKISDLMMQYARPSLTVLYIDRSESNSGRLIEALKTQGVPPQFDENAIVNNVLRGSYEKATRREPHYVNKTTSVMVKKVIPGSGEQLQKRLNTLVESDIAKKVMKSWFPWDSEHNEYSMKVVEKRGLHGATDKDVNIASVTQRGKALLKDAGKALIDRSYILVYDIYDIKTTKKQQSNKTVTFIETDYDIYLYKIDWTPELEADFFEQWNNPNAIDQMKIPVKNTGVIYADIPVKTRADGTIEDLAKKVIEKTNYALTKNLNARGNRLVRGAKKASDIEINDFKVKTPIYATSPIRAKIGTKEGVKVNQRYFVYEAESSDSGKVNLKRKGAVIASSRIAKNDGIATGDSPTTTFRQIQGGKLTEGMNLVLNPLEFGLGLTASAGTAYKVRIDAYVNRIKILDAMKIYLAFVIDPSADVKPVNIDGVDTYLLDKEGKEIKQSSSFTFNIGLAKDFFFARMFTFSPHVGASMSPSPVKEEDNEFNKPLFKNKKVWGVDAGADLGIAILPGLQIIGGAEYSTAKQAWFSGTTITGGLRVTF
jgi:hypothetical protein